MVRKLRAHSSDAVADLGMALRSSQGLCSARPHVIADGEGIILSSLQVPLNVRKPAQKAPSARGEAHREEAGCRLPNVELEKERVLLPSISLFGGQHCSCDDNNVGS